MSVSLSNLEERIVSDDNESGEEFNDFERWFQNRVKLNAFDWKKFQSLRPKKSVLSAIRRGEISFFNFLACIFFIRDLLTDGWRKKKTALSAGIF